jgi:hypothetical protein
MYHREIATMIVPAAAPEESTRRWGADTTS